MGSWGPFQAGAWGKMPQMPPPPPVSGPDSTNWALLI